MGLVTVIGGLAVSAVAYLVPIRPAWAGIVVPVGIGFLAVFLGGLAIGWSLPVSSRPPILRRGRIVLGLATWAIAGLAILATAPGSLAIFGPLRLLPSPMGQAAAVALGGVVYVGGVIVTTFGALYVLGFIGLAGLRRAGQWVTGRGTR